MSFLKNLFSPRRTEAPAAPANEFDRNPSAVAGLLDVEGAPEVGTRASGDAASEADFRRFRADFCFAPGRNLMQHLDAERLHQLAGWLDWQTPEAEPKAIVRLALTLLDRGINVWEQPGLTLYLHGRWWDGGGCTDQSYEALSTLARVLGKPIKFLYQERPDEEGFRVVHLNPE